MGDLMHALPALTDASQEIKDIKFDWVVDKKFSEIPKWHPAVNKIIETEHREWRKHLFKIKTRNALKQSVDRINKTNYDLILDMQNNLKSSFISYLCKQKVQGMNKHSVREYPAHWAYSESYNIPKKQHAIERQKQLLAFALGYEYQNNILNYGIEKSSFIKPDLELPKKYAVLVQNASWPSKLWSVDKWQKIVKYLESNKIYSLFPSGNMHELERAKKIASCSDKAMTLGFMNLNKMAYIIDQAKFAVCSDTGLAHLSSVVGTPSVTLYGPTNVDLIGTSGKNSKHLISKDQQMDSISVEQVLSATASFF